jgi:hypothetical protein
MTKHRQVARKGASNEHNEAALGRRRGRCRGRTHLTPRIARDPSRRQAKATTAAAVATTNSSDQASRSREREIQPSRLSGQLHERLLKGVNEPGRRRGPCRSRRRRSARCSLRSAQSAKTQELETKRNLNDRTMVGFRSRSQIEDT